LAVISIRNESRSPAFQPSNTSASSAALAEQVVGLGDELHVGVLDAVVDHLDVVAGAARTDQPAARHPVDLGGHRGQELLHQGVGLGGAAGHDAGAPQRPLLAPGHPRPEEAQAARVHGLLAADSVLEVAVAAVDQEVALVQVAGQLLEDGVDGRAGLDHDQDAARPGQGGHELLGRGGPDQLALVAVAVEQLAGPALGPVVDGHREPVPGRVAGQVRPHGGQAGDAQLALSSHRTSSTSARACRAGTLQERRTALQAWGRQGLAVAELSQAR
jgi:hypothetical protein